MQLSHSNMDLDMATTGCTAILVIELSTQFNGALGWRFLLAQLLLWPSMVFNLLLWPISS